jgi:hypothetical protein
LDHASGLLCGALVQPRAATKAQPQGGASAFAALPDARSRSRHCRGTGDVVAQSVERGGGGECRSAAACSSDDGADAAASAPRDAATDVRRAALVTLYGGCFVGPLGHAWYELLERVATRVWAPGSPRCIAAKIAADTLVFGPIHVASACAAALDCARACAALRLLCLLMLALACLRQASLVSWVWRRASRAR